MSWEWWYWIFGRKCIIKLRLNIIESKFLRLLWHIMLFLQWRVRMEKFLLDFVLKAQVGLWICARRELQLWICIWVLEKRGLGDWLHAERIHQRMVVCLVELVGNFWCSWIELMGRWRFWRISRVGERWSWRRFFRVGGERRGMWSE